MTQTTGIDERQEAATESVLELSELQSGILHPRPSPYVGTYVVYRVDDRHDGRTLLGRLARWVASAAEWSAQASAWVTVTITYQGLRAIGLPQESLDSFPLEFKEGMAARAELLGDVQVDIGDLRGDQPELRAADDDGVAAGRRRVDADARVGRVTRHAPGAQREIRSGGAEVQ